MSINWMVRMACAGYALVCIAACGALPAAPAQTAVAPAAVGMSAQGLDAMGVFMQRMVDEGELAGAITAVMRRGARVHWQVYGQRDLASGKPMTADTIFRIHSMTKPVVGVALMTLFEQGKFALDDPVARYLPELADLKVAVADGDHGKPITEPAAHAMTIRELVSHTGGFTYGVFARSQVDEAYMQANLFDRRQTLVQFVQKLGRLPLKFQPGTAWEYSVSVDVQGYLIEVLSGMPFEDYLQQAIFEPLDMVDTGFWVPPEKIDRLAVMYRQDRQGDLSAQADTQYFAPPSFPSGGGGLVSTAGDYLRFAQMLANGGVLDGVRILEPATLQMMHTNQLPEGVDQINPRVGNPGNTFGIDFALVSTPDGTTDHALAAGEFWWYGIGGTWFGVNPRYQLVMLGMIQNRGPAARKARIESKKLVYSAILD